MFATPTRIKQFKGGSRFLSNFYPAQVDHDGITYPTVEHAFQAAKTLDFGQRWLIAKMGSPSAAKRAGRKITLRPDWETAKNTIMLELVLQKFTRRLDLRQQLQATAEAELIEGNWWHDNYWGDCSCEDCDQPGKNVLGKILMDVRNILR